MMKNYEHLRTEPKRYQKAVFEAVFCSVGLVIFGYLVSYPFPVKLLSLAPLLMSAYIISRHIYSPMATLAVFFRDLFSRKKLIYTFIGLETGMAAAMYYRGSIGLPVLPATIESFALVGMTIGIVEECVFRGFIQGRLMKLDLGLAVAFTALAHALYKASLFLAPAAQHLENMTSFFLWSFAGYIVLGVLRYYSKSMAAVIIAHATFDLMLYAENLQAPFWVW